MRELMKLDVLTKKIVRHLDKTKKAVKVIKGVTVAWTAFTVVATAISMIPRYEKLKVDGEELIKQCETPDAAESSYTLADKPQDEAVTV